MKSNQRVSALLIDLNGVIWNGPECDSAGEAAHGQALETVHHGEPCAELLCELWRPAAPFI